MEIVCEYCGVECEDYFLYSTIGQIENPENEPVGSPWWCSQYCYEKDCE